MKSILIVLAVFLAGVWTAAAADVSGKWAGSIEMKQDNESRSVPVFMTFKLDGGKLSGSAGLNESEQYPISKGTADGAAVTFEVEGGGEIYYVDLKIDGDQLIGGVRRGDSPKMKVSLKRS